jgi:hypothetical protein
MTIKQFIILAILLLFGLTSNIYGLETSKFYQPDIIWDWNPFTQTSSAYRIHSIQGFEIILNTFVERTVETGRDDLEHGNIRHTYVKGLNAGFHAGYRELGFNIGYGYFAGWPTKAFTTGWNTNVLFDYIHNGSNSLLNQQKYVGIEVEGAFLFLNLAGGIKHCLTKKDRAVLFIGAGLRY